MSENTTKEEEKKTVKTSSAAVKKAKAAKKPAKKTPAAPKKSAAKKPAKKAAKPKAQLKPNGKVDKKAFIGMYPNMTASELIAQAKKAGFALSANYIYLVRRGNKSPKASAATKRAKSSNGSSNGAFHVDGFDGSSFFDALAAELATDEFLKTIADKIAQKLLGG